MKYCFPDNPKQFELPVVAKRKEVANFDIEEGFRSIGIARGGSPETVIFGEY